MGVVTLRTARFQASAMAVLSRSSGMLRGVVYRRFEITYRPHVQGSSSPGLLDGTVDLLVKGMLGRMGGPILLFVRHFELCT